MQMGMQMFTGEGPGGGKRILSWESGTKTILNYVAFCGNPFSRFEFLIFGGDRYIREMCVHLENYKLDSHTLALNLHNLF